MSKIKDFAGSKKQLICGDGTTIKGTLDYHHKQRIKKFTNELMKINQNIQNCQQKLSLSPNHEKIEQKLSELYQQRKNLEQAQKDYYLKVMDLLSKYYYSSKNSENDQKNVSNDTNIPHKNQSFDLTLFIEKTTKINKTDLFNEYMFRLTNNTKNKKITYTNLHKICSECGTKLTVDTLKSRYVCENCGYCYFALLDHDKTIYVKHPVIEINSFSYRRYDHFVEWLNKFHNTDKSKVPKKIYDLINKELKKQHKSYNDLTEENILEILKKTGHTKYNCQSSQILKILNKKKLPTLPAHIQHQMKTMFKQTLQPFTEICPRDRTNFLSYSYVIRKFLEILKQYEYIKYFPLLKSKEKLYQQDLIWKNICHKLKWTFYPTI